MRRMRPGCPQCGEELGSASNLIRQPLADQMLQHLRDIRIVVGVLMAQRSGSNHDTAANDLEVATKQPETIGNGRVALWIDFANWSSPDSRFGLLTKPTSTTRVLYTYTVSGSISPTRQPLCSNARMAWTVIMMLRNQGVSAAGNLPAFRD